MKLLQISIQKPLKSDKSLINPLINPGLRFFPNIAPYSNDAPYCLLPSCKKSEISHDLFLRKWAKTPIFDT